MSIVLTYSRNKLKQYGIYLAYSVILGSFSWYIRLAKRLIVPKYLIPCRRRHPNQLTAQKLSGITRAPALLQLIKTYPTVQVARSRIDQRPSFFFIRNGPDLVPFLIKTGSCGHLTQFPKVCAHQSGSERLNWCGCGGTSDELDLELNTWPTGRGLL